jgi:molybdate transport system substrate-binding protein
MPGRGHVAVATLLVASAGCRTAPAVKPPLRVAAASDLAFAFRDVGALYERATGQPVVFSFGSTGLLEKQVAEGAPFDVFAAASVSYADEAIASGVCLPGSRALYATGRIVLYAGPDAPFVPRTVADLADPRVRRIAIAHPDHAPYGRAARQAMTRAGVWEQVQPKVVFAENVQQALGFAQSGNADVAILALSLATVTPGRTAPVPADLHDPLDQALVVCTKGSAGPESGRRFAAFVASPEAREVMRRYGFLLPGESAASAAGVAGAASAAGPPAGSPDAAKPGNTDR